LVAGSSPVGHSVEEIVRAMSAAFYDAFDFEMGEAAQGTFEAS
jgi:hypothetical protein